MTQPAFNAQNQQSPFKLLDVNQQPKFGGLQPFEGTTLLLEGDFPLADPCPPLIPGGWGSPSHPTNHPRLYRQKVSYNNPVKQKNKAAGKHAKLSEGPSHAINVLSVLLRLALHAAGIPSAVNKDATSSPKQGSPAY